MAPEDLREYAGLTTTVVTCKQRVPMYAAGLDLIRWSFESMFGAVVNLPDDDEDGDTPAAVKKEEDASDDEYDPEAQLEDTPAPEKKQKVELSGQTFRIMDSVTVRCRNHFVEIEWEGNVINDGVADACLAILTSLESSPAAVKRNSPPQVHPSLSTLTNASKARRNTAPTPPNPPRTQT